jgi:hypothetical protein
VNLTITLAKVFAELRVTRCRDGPISIPNTRYYRYQGFEEKYQYWHEISIVSILLSLRYFFILVSGLIMKMIPKSLNRRKYYQSSSFSMVLNGPQTGSEFVVMLVTIMKINVLKMYSTSMILASKR